MNDYSKLYKSTGIFRYSQEGADLKLVVEVDQAISDMYRSLIPKYYSVARPGYKAHITLVRVGKEVPKDLNCWGRYNYNKVDFLYSPYIHHDQRYFWLNVFCVRLEEVRAELGLPTTSRYTVPPDGFKKAFHITIGNRNA